MSDPIPPDTATPEPARPEPKAPRQNLDLRERPQPIRRISRTMLIGGAAAFLILMAGIVLVALRPPSFRGDGASELYNVDRKPISDGLSRLPSTYDGMQAQRPAASPASRDPALPPGVPQLQTPAVDPNSEAERVEKARLARMAGQANALIIVLKGLPLAYNKDLQETQEPLFEATWQ